MERRAAKDQLFHEIASVARALGSGRRAEIVDLLAQGERSVEQVAAQIQQSVANTSQHLQVLARAGLVQTRREGTHVIYRLASDEVIDLWRLVRSVASQHVAAVRVLADEYLGTTGQVEHVTATELRERMASGRVVVLDVRPRPEYDAGHVAGARSIPIDELAEAIDSLPKRTQIVAYCRGPYCVYADDAVRMLNASGRSARRLESGCPEWRLAGLPVDLPQPETRSA